MNLRLHTADSSLDESTKEERQVERLIDKEPAPSRKHTPRRGPKHDNRRTRMKTDDPDMNSSDKDMSLNYKSSSILAIASRIAEDPKPKGKKPSPLKVKSEPLNPKSSPIQKSEKTEKSEKSEKTEKSPSKDEPVIAAPKEVDQLKSALQEESSVLARDFEKFTHEFLLKPGGNSSKISRWCTQQLNRLDKTSNHKIQGSAGKVADIVVDLWPRDIYAFGVRAGMIRAVDRSMARIDLPKSFVNVFRKTDISKKNKELVRELIEDDKSLSASDLQGKDFISFTALAVILPILRENPAILDSADIRKKVDESTKVVYEQAHQVLSLKAFVDAWAKAAGGSAFTDANRSDPGPETDPNAVFDEASAALKSFVSGKNKILDPKQTFKTLKEELMERYGKVPPELDSMLRAASSQSSYGREVNKAMPNKTAAYHGVIGQGHPEGPTNSYHPIDRRHLGKQHYDSIVKLAQDLLKEDWLKFAWEGGAKDAPVRAALDLAIHTADGCEYQSKIDTETYNMLLNRLAGWDHDMFVDTLLPEKKRSASIENPHIQSILRVASEIRSTDPRGALEIIKNLRSMISSSDYIAQDGLTEKDMDSLPEGNLDMKDLKNQSKKLVDAKNVDDFASGLKGLSETMSKSASTRIAAASSWTSRYADELEKLEVLEDMSDDQVKALLDDQKAKAKELENKAGLDDIEGFLKGLDDMFASLDDAAKKVETASVRIQVATLIRIAQSSPEAFRALKPLLVIAKKKMDKKKPKKTSQKKDEKPEDKAESKKDEKKSDKKKDDKKPGKKPFGGKGAPPFGKGKGKMAPPFKKKASDETITASDSEW